MKIVYTKHALEKFKSLAHLGWKFTKGDIRTALSKPDHSSENKETGIKIVLKEVDKDHNLRVVSTEENGIIRVITFYPTPKGRYENA